MAKKFVRCITDIGNINEQDLTTSNVNDLLSDGEDIYIHRKLKNGKEEYYCLTNGSGSTTEEKEIIGSDTITIVDKEDSKQINVSDTVLNRISSVEEKVSGLTPKEDVVYYETNLQPDRVHVIRLGDTDGGNTTIVETNGLFFLLDAGCQPSKKEWVYNHFKEYCKSIGATTFEFAIVSHFDDDHYCLLDKTSLLDDFTVKKVMLEEVDQTMQLSTRLTRYKYNEFVKVLDSKNVPYDVLPYNKRLDPINVGDFTLQITNNRTFNAEELALTDKNVETGYDKLIENFMSLGYVLTKNTYKYYQPCDIEKYDERETLVNGEIDIIKDTDVYCMAHHGLRTTSNTNEFLYAINATQPILTVPITDFTSKGLHGGTTAIEYYKSIYGDILIDNVGQDIVIDFTDTRNGITVTKGSYNKNIAHDINVVLKED